MFNIKIHNDTILNDKDTLIYIFQTIINGGNIEFFIDESPALETINLGQTNFLEWLNKICHKFSIPKENIKIKIENLIQRDVWPNIERCYESVDVLYGQDIKFKCEKELRYKTSIFVGGSRWPRLSLASYIHKFHRDSSVITYWQHLKDNSQPAYLYVDELFKQVEVDDELIERCLEFTKHLPLHIEETDLLQNKNGGYIDYTQAYNLCGYYNNIFCDVVCETVHNGTTFAFTEKIARCWLTKTPFLVFGPKNYLLNLKRLGFQTFDKFWSERYDGFENRNRIVFLQRQIDYIHSLDIKALEKLYFCAEMQEILENNHKVFMTLDQEKIRKVFI
jgi:hypothetical protein